jgi:hypothetical protein
MSRGFYFLQPFSARKVRMKISASVITVEKAAPR